MGHEVYTDFRCFATWCLLAGKRANRSAHGGGSAAIANMSIENGRPAIFEAQKLTFTRRKIDATMAVGTVRQQHSTTYRFPYSFLSAIAANLDIANLPSIHGKYGAVQS